MPEPNDQKLIPTLFNLAHSQAFRVIWALEELSAVHGTKYHLKNFARTSGAPIPELKAAHRLGKSPIMTLETTDGSPPPTIQLEPGVLSESRMILRWLSEEFGQGMWDPEPSDVRRNEFLEDFAVSTLAPKATFPMLFEIIPGAYPFPLSYILPFLFKPVKNWFIGDLRDVYQLLEDALSDEKPWFAGKKIGLSDFNMTWGMEMCDQRGYFEEKKRWPRLAGWLERVRGREAYKRAHELGCGYDLKYFGVKGADVRSIMDSTKQE
ncbi:hypothetical protein BDV96DRAFT_596495 [Lophiotrema nucula]|uniref:GST C-terminal domain-containing protein n=1 Tax=Lophiotrema nucula TaxID=690887 RepID=A0A6A5ZJM5_9PLEO|nr:hypothetical protein BDV96DRAFT_596495 [Lophiotrema nucula]